MFEITSHALIHVCTEAWRKIITFKYGADYHRYPYQKHHIPTEKIAFLCG